MHSINETRDPTSLQALCDFSTSGTGNTSVPNCKPRTADSYLSIINQHLKPDLGQLPLGKIKPMHILRYQSDKLAGDPAKGIRPLSSSSVRHHHMVLHGALKSAVDWEFLGQNPCDAVKAPRQGKAQLQTWNKEEISLFLEAAHESVYYNLFYTEIYTGLRLGEIMAPRWRELDMKRGMLEVTRSLYQRHGQLEFGSLKNASSYRTIQLTSQNLVILEEQRKKQEFYHMMLEIPFTQDSLIFGYPDGRPWLPSSVSRAWQDIARHSGIKVIRFHDARHTHASMLMAAGWNPKLVQERLGHSSINTTMDIYSHTTPEMHREAMKRFDEFMGL